MELEGLIRCRKSLEDKAVVVESLTTDRHPSITNYMRSKWPGVQHYFDTWHIAKGNELVMRFYYELI